jgi:ATP-dependent Clp protease adaptor protein ClpS
MSEKDRDEPKDNEGGTAVAAKPKKKSAPKTKRPPPKPLPPWKVLLHNDDKNSIPYVIQTIVQLTAINVQQAIVKTMTAHRRGVCLLLTTHRERAELYRDQFQSKGLTVTVEPAEA